MAKKTENEIEYKVGQIVTYKTTEQDKEDLTQRYETGSANVSDELPAIVTSVHGKGCVNLRVFIDGIGDFWKTSISIGESDGQCK